MTEATETLVTYLDSDGKQAAQATLPQDEVDAWLPDMDWRIVALADDPAAHIGDIIASSPQLASGASREIAAKLLIRYAEDARAVPLSDLVAAIGAHGTDPVPLAHLLQVDLPCIFRRLAATDAASLAEVGLAPVGLVACDASGTLTFRKHLLGFDMPRFSAACPIWPLFQSLGRPMVPFHQVVTMGGRDESSFETTSISTLDYPKGFDGPQVVEAWMLIRPLIRLPDATMARRIGTSCRVCSETDCVARREPSVFAMENDTRL